MFGRRETIDAGAALDRADSARIPGERGASRVGSEARPRVPGARLFVLFALAVMAALMAAFFWKAWSLRAEGETKQAASVRQVIPALPARIFRADPIPEPPKPPVAPVSAPVPPRASAPREKTLEEKIRERMLKSSLKSGGAASAAASSPGGPDSTILASSREKPGELAGKLEPLRLKGAAAGAIPDRDMFITQGTMIDCVLETRMVTDQPGMAVCLLTRDVVSASGRVVLLDRGSKVVGFYEGGLKQGQARIFVQWSRVETPEGVIIELASPGTGPLGEGGVGGNIDTHFWERFGGAILISVVGDLSKAVSSLASGASGGDQSNTSISFENTSEGAKSAVTEALKSSVDIPPTLSKNQGERVAILVARDLDFRGVYGLKPR